MAVGGVFSCFEVKLRQCSTCGCSRERRLTDCQTLASLTGSLENTIQWHILELALQKSGRAYSLKSSDQICAPLREPEQLQLACSIPWEGTSLR